MFGFGKPKQDGKAILADLLSHGVKSIIEREGKSQRDAEYLAICALIEDLTEKKSQTGYQNLIALTEEKYPQHLNDVLTYVAWTTGKFTFEKEKEAELLVRHS